MRRVVCALLPLVAACPTPPVQRPGPAPTAAQLVTVLRDRAAKIPSLRAEAKVDYLQTNGERIKLAMTFLARRPADLRIDAESPMGGTIASLASDGKQFQLLDVQNNRFITGEASPCAIGQLIRVRLRPSEVAAVLDGSVPLVGDPVSVGWDGSDGGRDVLTLRGDGLTETIKLSPKEHDVREAEVTGPDGKVLYRVVHDEFEDQAGLRFPQKTQIFDPSHKADAKIRFHSREIDPKIPENAFHLDPPPGLPVEHIDCR